MSILESERTVDHRAEMILGLLFDLFLLTSTTDRPYGGHPLGNSHGLLLRQHHAARSANFA